MVLFLFYSRSLPVTNSAYVASKVVQQKEHENKRKWLVKYAKERGFDPLVAEKWYSQTLRDIGAVKVCLFSFSFIPLRLLMLTKYKGRYYDSGTLQKQHFVSFDRPIPRDWFRERKIPSSSYVFSFSFFSLFSFGHFYPFTLFLSFNLHLYV